MDLVEQKNERKKVQVSRKPYKTVIQILLTAKITHLNNDNKN